MNQVMVATQTQTMSSLEISKLTGKRHDNVMRDIRSMLSDLEQSSNLSLFVTIISIQNLFRTKGQVYSYLTV